MNPFDGMLAMIRSAVREELTAAGLERPAPHPIAVTVKEAAALIAVSDQTIRRLIAQGHLRTIDLGDVDLTRIPTVALFELDPEYRPGDGPDRTCAI